MNGSCARPSGPPAPRHQAGAATLLVVMVLFFIVSMVAAYTSRNLVFEQRTSANQYRSTQALEAAEAGLEWTISMLNTGRINGLCEASTNLTDTSFRERYLDVDATGRIKPKLSAAATELSVGCVFNSSGGWDCLCGTAGGAPALVAPTAAGIFPAFRVRFQQSFAHPGNPLVARQPRVVRVQVVGCTRADAAGADPCLTYTGLGAASEGRAVITSLVALAGGLASPSITLNAVGQAIEPLSLPNAALTARGSISVTGSGLTAANADATTGLAVHAGGSVSNVSVVTPAGTPAAAASNAIIQNDVAAFGLPASTLSASSPVFTSSDRMFVAFFGMRPATFRDQQAALVTAPCPLTGCLASVISDVARLNPWRPIWVDGDLVGNATTVIGSPANPVLLVVKGSIKSNPSPITVHGLVYTRVDDWVTDGAGGRINGAAVAENTISGTGGTTIVYNADVLRLVRWNTGSFVRVNGSWQDFQ